MASPSQRLTRNTFEHIQPENYGNKATDQFEIVEGLDAWKRPKPGQNFRWGITMTKKDEKGGSPLLRAPEAPVQGSYGALAWRLAYPWGGSAVLGRRHSVRDPGSMRRRGAAGSRWKVWRNLTWYVEIGVCRFLLTPQNGGFPLGFLFFRTAQTRSPKKEKKNCPPKG